MASWYSVAIAALMYLFYQWVGQDPFHELNAVKPMMPSMLVFIGVLDLIGNKVELPPPILYTACWLYIFIYELIISIFVLYLSMSVFWQPLETVIMLMMRIILCGYRLQSEETYNRYEEYWIGSITLPLSLIILVMLSRSLFYIRTHLMKYLNR
ncbi:uncharacterized protein LOC117582462 [Drosophila guanche]|uniref:Uncharacterized protein n=1 Tax=Drosophila guanche TaxID=7266 RepID=A0A3B0JUI9_DROGU|nr:uncharacterized protein LOC117582462 [Drosophila guanche]SPP79140.1 Hypothetical predicted protein [Drosophila guanche]